MHLIIGTKFRDAKSSVTSSNVELENIYIEFNWLELGRIVSTIFNSDVYKILCINKLICKT